MSVREYVGARYVPIIAGEWDNTHTYEPLMVVTYQGASYTSRQYVPAGIEITNESYWVLSADYNAQVEAYRKEVRDILPYDETPTEGSTKGVTSDGIKKAINTAVADEATRATEAEHTNATAISAETTRATEAEQANATEISSVNSKLDKKADIDNLLWKSIEDFGCSSESDDNSAALNSALLQSVANGFKLYVPNKTYNFTSNVVLPWYSTLVGLDANTSTLHFSGPCGVTVANDTNGNNFATGITLRDLHLEGSYEFDDRVWKNVDWNTTDPSFNSIGLKVYYVVSSCIENLVIEKFGTGVMCAAPNYQLSPTGNAYYRQYGGVVKLSNFSIYKCYNGVVNQISDNTFTKFIIQYTRTPVSSAQYCEFNDLHVWVYCKACNLGPGNHTNIYVEGAFALRNSSEKYSGGLTFVGSSDCANVSCLYYGRDYYNQSPSGETQIFSNIPTIINGCQLRTLNDEPLNQSVFSSSSTMIVFAAFSGTFSDNMPHMVRNNVIGTIIAPKDPNKIVFTTPGVNNKLQKLVVTDAPPTN